MPSVSAYGKVVWRCRDLEDTAPQPSEPPAARGPAPPLRADAIVVLGCALHAGAPSPALRRRVECGAALLARGVAPLLVLSGGGRSGRPEAEPMAALAAALGVPPARMLLEPRSRDTIGNAFNSAALLRARGLASVVLVSDAYHLARARILFRRAGLIVAATDHPPPRSWLRELPFYLRELAALAVNLCRLAIAPRWVGGQ
jgi:uncharacterized SAM-binding protein YcdF (DUF218 family)